VAGIAFERGTVHFLGLAVLTHVFAKPPQSVERFGVVGKVTLPGVEQADRMIEAGDVRQAVCVGLSDLSTVVDGRFGEPGVERLLDAVEPPHVREDEHLLAADTCLVRAQRPGRLHVSGGFFEPSRAAIDAGEDELNVDVRSVQTPRPCGPCRGAVIVAPPECLISKCQRDERRGAAPPDRSDQQGQSADQAEQSAVPPLERFGDRG